MKKAALRKLRTLRASPAIIKRANEDKPYTEEYRYSWSSEIHTRTIEAKYAYYMRCQNLNDIIKVAIFFAPIVRSGNLNPSIEIFLYPSGNEWITRYWDEEGKEQWNKAMIDNLNLPIPIPGATTSKYQSNYKYACLHEAWINPEGKKTLKGLLGDDNERPIKSPTDFIQIWQEKAKESQRLEAQRRECERWDEKLKIVPEMPKGIKPWAIRHVLKPFFFYKTGDKEGFCTACERAVKLPEKPKHKEEMKCPHCKRKGILQNTNLMSRHLRIETRRCQTIQQVDNALILRVFWISGSYRDRKIDNPNIYIEEYGRKIYKDGAVSGWIYGDYKHKTTRWIPGSYAYFEGPIYPKTRITMQRSGLPVLIKAQAGIEIDRYMELESKYPVIESMAKIGLYKMVSEIVGRETSILSYIDFEEKSVIKALKLDSARLKRLTSINGGKQALTWFQYEKRADTQYPDQLIRDFDAAGICPRDLVNIQTIYKGWQEAIIPIYNYLTKQSAICQESLRQTLTTYDDYLSMARQNKCRMDLEQIIKPRHLKEAHDHQIRISKQEEISKQAKEINKKYKKLTHNIKELSKYEFTDGTYSIIAPKSTEDIIVEGLTLEHCIHRCDFYFERICSKESFILFLRKAKAPDSPWYTLEVEPGGNIRQKRTTGDKQNKDLEKALPFLKKWQKKVVESMDAKEKKLAATADAKRRKNYADIRKEKKKIWHGIHQGELLADILEADFLAAI